MKTDIKLGPLTLALEVNAAFDDDGEYVGQVVNWEDVTAARKAEFEAAKMGAMIHNAPINIILADKDFNITYANPARVETLKPLTHLAPYRSTRSWAATSMFSTRTPHTSVAYWPIIRISRTRRS